MEDLKKFKKDLYGEHLTESDHGFFGEVSSDEKFSAESETRNQPFTGQYYV